MMEPSKTELIFLGTGAGTGVPSFFCGCPACQEAAADPRFSRGRCSLLIRGDENILVDAPPELRVQLVRERIERIDHFILTHSHYDHSGGLGDLEFYSRVGCRHSIPAYMTVESQEWLQGAFGFMQDCLIIQTVGDGWQFDLGGIRFTGLPVTHAPGTLGLLIEPPGGRRTAYIPDTGPLSADTLDLLQGVDTLILGATFWGRNWMPEDHLSIDEALQIAGQVGAGRLYLTHVAMHYDTPITSRELDAYLQATQANFHLAYDGTRIEI